jgi:uncharacterized coiled-coil protein SlyX
MPVDQLPNELEPDAQRILGPPRSRKGYALAVIALLVIVSAAGAYAWISYDGVVQNVVSAAQPSTAQPVTNQREPILLEDFQALQKQMADSLKSVNENLVAQKADLQRLSEQVSALATRLDSMQSTAPTGLPQQAVPARPAVAAQRKKPSAPGRGPTSIGGAPLPSNPADSH